MGKTSLMRETARRLKGQYHCLFVDLQKAAAAPDAIVELSLAVHPYQSLWRKVGGVFSGAFSKFRHNIESVNLSEFGISLRADLSDNWQQKGDQLVAVWADSDLPVLILIDEAPILINRILKDTDYRITPEGRSKADLFLSWLRDNSLRHQGKIRMVLSGSIGLGPILRQGRLYNIYYLFRRRGTPAQRVRAVVHFMINFYESEQLVNVAKNIVDELTNLEPEHCQDHYQVYFLMDGKMVRENMNEAISLLVELTARGGARTWLRLLSESPACLELEPLLVGMRMYLGKEVKVAAEIKEIGHDVVKRIHQRQEELKTLNPTVLGLHE